jgi:hypothetical protein
MSNSSRLLPSAFLVTIILNYFKGSGWVAAGFELRFSGLAYRVHCKFWSKINAETGVIWVTEAGKIRAGLRGVIRFRKKNTLPKAGCPHKIFSV